MTATEGRPRPAIAPPDEDPNATGGFSSPPCFLHELDPAYLGYLSRGEVRALLGAVLAAPCLDGMQEAALMRPKLHRHLAGMGGAFPGDPDQSRDAPRPGGPPPTQPGAEELAARLREALPRLQDDLLRRHLSALLPLLDRAGRAGPGRQDRG